MPIESAFILSDVFLSIRDLAEECISTKSAPTSSSNSQDAADDPGISASQIMREVEMNGTQDPTVRWNRLNRLKELVGEQGCKDVIDFWKEEWLLE